MHNIQHDDISLSRNAPILSYLSGSLFKILLYFQTAHSPRWYIHIAGTFHGNAVHARVDMSCLDPKCQSSQHLLHRLHRGVAESNESGK